MKINTVLDYNNLFTHTAIIGATGAGKSTFLYEIMNSIIMQKQNKIVIIDGKSDLSFYNKIKLLCIKNKYALNVYSNNKQIPSTFCYSVLNNKDLNQSKEIITRLKIKENMFASLGAQYYLNLSNKLIWLIVNGLYKHNKQLSRDNLLYYANRKNILDIVDDVNNLKGCTEEVYSDVRDFFSTYIDEANSLNKASLFDHLLNNEKEVIFFSLDFLTYQNQSKDLAQMVCLDLRQCINKKQLDLFFVLDEFGSYINSDLITVFEQGRSYKTGLIFAFQSLGSFYNKNNFKQILFDNTDNWFIFKMKDDYSINEVIKLFGVTKTLQASYNFDLSEDYITKGSYHSVDTYYVSNEEIRNLKFGNCFIKTLKTPRYYCEYLEVQNNE